MSDPAKWIPEAYEFDERCRRLVRQYEHQRKGTKMLVVKALPHIVIQHHLWLFKAGKPEEKWIEELCVFYSPTNSDHTTCYVSQNGAMHNLVANDHWWPAIRAAVPFLRNYMLLDEIANV